MDNAQKAIMIGVGLFITIIIISAVLLIVNLGTGLVDDATAELRTMSSSLQNQILQSYDNKTLTGVQVRIAIQQYLRSSDMVVVLLGSTTSGATTTQGITATVGTPRNINSVTINGATDDFFTVAANIYQNTETSNNHESTMTQFNNVARAGTTYVEPSLTYTSYVLRVLGTETIVGIVFVPSTITISGTGATNFSLLTLT